MKCFVYKIIKWDTILEKINMYETNLIDMKLQ